MCVLCMLFRPSHLVQIGAMRLGRRLLFGPAPALRRSLTTELSIVDFSCNQNCMYSAVTAIVMFSFPGLLYLADIPGVANEMELWFSLSNPIIRA